MSSSANFLSTYCLLASSEAICGSSTHMGGRLNVVVLRNCDLPTNSDSYLWIIFPVESMVSLSTPEVPSSSVLLSFAAICARSTFA